MVSDTTAQASINEPEAFALDIDQAVASYTIEENSSKSSEILDIQRLMLLRLQAGYRVDRVRINAALSTRFMTCQS